MTLTAIESFLVVASFLAIGEFVSTKTKAYIPSVFVTATLFVIGFWTFLPKTVVATSSFGADFTKVCMSLLLVHLGTMMSLRKLLQQWKAITIALAGVAGTVLIAMTIGQMIFGYQFAVAITPPLTGGLVAAKLMSDALLAKGLMDLTPLPIAMFALHSFIGYPITAYLLKVEGRRILADYRKNGPDQEILKDSIASNSERKKLIPRVPEEYQTPYLIWAKAIFVGILAHYLAKSINGVINEYIIALVFGVIACEIGFLEEQAMSKAGSINWLMGGILAIVFSTLSLMTPAIFMAFIFPILAMIVLGIIGMFITSALMSKMLGYSKEMGFACALTALFGFPADYIVTKEVCQSVSENKEEFDYTMEIMLPRMLVGGFATVTIASVAIATIFVQLL